MTTIRSRMMHRILRLHAQAMLNLNRIYAANPHAVAMQVYAAGLVYPNILGSSLSCHHPGRRCPKKLAAVYREIPMDPGEVPTLYSCPGHGA
jgi:hypothetical protein